MKFLIGVVLGFLLIPILFFAYVRFGYAPVATAASPFPMERKLAHMALNARIDKEAPKNEPFQPSSADFENGAHLYRQHCEVCHGGIDTPKSSVAKGMFPKPPQLLQGKGVTDDPAGETYWKVANGIRLTGMPAYSKAFTIY